MNSIRMVGTPNFELLVTCDPRFDLLFISRICECFSSAYICGKKKVFSSQIKPDNQDEHGWNSFDRLWDRTTHPVNPQHLWCVRPESSDRPSSIGPLLPSS